MPSCPSCKSQVLPNPELESDWQLVRCGCGALVEIGHGDPVIRKPATPEDFKEAAARSKYWDDIYWRKYGPVYRTLDFEFCQQVEKENKLPEPPTDSAQEIHQDLEDIRNDLLYVKGRFGGKSKKMSAPF